MAALSVWNPMSELMSMRDAINHLFNEAFVRPDVSGVTGTIPFDLVERPDDVSVRAAVPGLDPNSLQVTVQQNLLTLTGRRSLAGAGEARGITWYVRGLSDGDVRLAVSLPVAVDAEHARATYEQGVVTVTLPKAETARPRRVQVTSVENRQALAAGVAS